MIRNDRKNIRTTVNPNRLLQGGHRQTLAGALFPARSVSSKGERHDILVSGGDQLVTRYHAATRSDPRSSPLAIIFHGLGGSMDSNYIHEFSNDFLKKGYSVLRVNHRGVGEGLPLAKEIYHSGLHLDLQAVIRFAKKHFPHTTLFAVGFSFSGNLLLNLLSKETDDLPDYTLSVNPAIDLHHSALQLQKGVGKLYDRLFVKDLVGLLIQKRKLDLFPKEISFDGIRWLSEFDERITAPLTGFATALDYYRTYSSAPLVSKITAPCAVLTAEDDPIVGSEPFFTAKWSDSTVVWMERHGGHMGYIGRSGKELVSLGMQALENLVLRFPKIVAK